MQQPVAALLMTKSMKLNCFVDGSQIAHILQH